MEAIDAEVFAALRDDSLRPAVVEQAVALALEALPPERQERARDGLGRELIEWRLTASRV